MKELGKPGQSFSPIWSIWEGFLEVTATHSAVLSALPHTYLPTPCPSPGRVRTQISHRMRGRGPFMGKPAAQRGQRKALGQAEGLLCQGLRALGRPS